MNNWSLPIYSGMRKQQQHKDPPADAHRGGGAAVPPGGPPQRDGAAQPHPERNQPNRQGNQAGMNLLERLTDVLERMRQGLMQRDVFKAPK